MSETLVVNEIFLSIQGESTFAGLPCVFVRLTACPLRCSYCDTAYAFKEGRRSTVREVSAEVRRLAAGVGSGGGTRHRPLVEVTGGEPLAQPAALPLMRALCDDGFTVLLETSGALDIGPVDTRVHRIMDLKCPASGECNRNRWENLAQLKQTDEIKFVISTREDYAWAKEQVARHDLASLCPVLFSPVSALEPSQRDPSLKPAPAGQRPLTRRELAECVLADGLPVRLQLQMHKFIWPPAQKGV
jgi:7-carboxy-7-deazaguanine synthase